MERLTAAAVRAFACLGTARRHRGRPPWSGVWERAAMKVEINAAEEHKLVQQMKKEALRQCDNLVQRACPHAGAQHEPLSCCG